MTATKTNERPGTRAQVKNVRMSATKARVVLDLIRNKSIDEAGDVLTYTERSAAEVIGKLLDSAVANAEHNDQLDPESLFVSACYADEGRTMYRWRPRARGRATKIRKRTCHITLIVSPMAGEMLRVEQAKREAVPGSRASRRRGQQAADRAARVAASQDDHDHDHDHDDVSDVAEDEGIVDTTAEATELANEAMEAADAGTADETDTGTPDTGEESTDEPSEPSASEADNDDEESRSVPTGSDEERSDEDAASKTDEGGAS